MIKPGTYDLILYRHTQWTGVVLRFQDENGDPEDLTGWTGAFAQVRLMAISASVILTLPAQITDAATGEVTLGPVDLETGAAVPAGIYRWDLLLAHADGNRLGPYLEGNFTVKGAVTQPG
jgi:hypothetical protein